VAGWLTATRTAVFQPERRQPSAVARSTVRRGGASALSRISVNDSARWRLCRGCRWCGSCRRLWGRWTKLTPLCHPS